MRLSKGVTRSQSKQLGGDGLVRQIDPDDLAEQYLCILLLAQDDSRCRRDLTDREDARRDLIEQRLEQMMGRLRDERDVDVRALKVLRGEQSAEAGTDDDDAMSSRGNARDAHWKYSSRDTP